MNINEMTDNATIPTSTYLSNLATLYNKDTRTILPTIKSKSIDCVVTSPPYGNIKNYGSEDQIGFGQNLDQYFVDLKSIFLELFRIAKRGAPLWLIVDNIKYKEKGIPLPWELMQLAKDSGWDFQDIIVWDKGKSLPWSHKGRFRNHCEFIILMSKGKINHFNIDKIRDSESLSDYWIKYPERYNPLGKAPGDLWHFPIPVQGSWGDKNIRHFCPFPIALIQRILEISTVEGDTVMDPFSGTGSVIGVASNMGRRGIGIEINTDFCKHFTSDHFLITHETTANIEDFSNKIISLRKMKIAKELFKKLSGTIQTSSKPVDFIFIKDINSIIKDDFVGSIKIYFACTNDYDFSQAQSMAEELLNRPPLSKYGLHCSVEFISTAQFQTTSSIDPINNLFLYKSGKFYFHSGKISQNELFSLDFSESIKIPYIVSPFEIKIETPG